MNALDYLLKVNLYGLLFVSCYWLFLRRHTFFSLNRFYLLTAAILSLVLPLVSLPTQTVEIVPADWPVPVGVINLPVATLAPAPVQADTAPDWETIALIAYGLIAALLVLRLAVRVGRLCWLIRRSRQQVFADYVLIETPKTTHSSSESPTFSFFRYLVINPADTHNELIIRHELVHIRQVHSADVLGLALLRAFFWACPTLWFIDRMLRQVHEFLADREASQPTEYARFLLEYAFGLQPDALTNGFFNPSLLRQRIQMLYQTATPRWALGKYTLILPLVLGLLAMTTARQEIVSVVDQLQDKTVTVTGSVTSSVDGKPLPGVLVVVKNIEKRTYTDSKGTFTIPHVSTNASLQFSFAGFSPQNIPVNGHTTIAVSLAPRSTSSSETVKNRPSTKVDNQSGDVLFIVEQQPQFPGGIRALNKFIASHLRYPTDAYQNNVQGKVYVTFIVDKAGDLRELRILKGIGSGCDEEAIRVVSQMPNWIPGEQQGKAVSVMYNLPIQFALDKKADKRTGQVSSPTTDSPTGLLTYSHNNSKNARFALYNDIRDDRNERYGIPLPDSLKPSRPTVTIRANGFDVGGDPLYIIDGLYASKEKLDKIDPNSIVSIDVQKGPSAMVLHGEKARYGVVSVTTKRK